MLTKDFLTLAEISPPQLEFILSLSSKLKSTRGKAGGHLLRGKSVALLFEKPSTRTRVSFQVATNELGGFPIVLSASEIQLGRGETIEDTARVLSRLVHVIMARVILHEEVARLAEASSVPVINGLSDLYHPVQILADLLTLKERNGSLKGLKVAWVGDGNNVCNSWMYGAALSGIDLHVATPPLYRPLAAAIQNARRLARVANSTITVTDDPIQAVSDSDCVITDTFVSMGFDKERDERIKTFLPKYQVNEKLMAHAKKNAIFQHCLPAHRGEEVTAAVIDGRNSAVWDESENRLHTTKALLLYLLLGQKRVHNLLKSL